MPACHGREDGHPSLVIRQYSGAASLSPYMALRVTADAWRMLIGEGGIPPIDANGPDTLEYSVSLDLPERFS